MVTEKYLVSEESVSVLARFPVFMSRPKFSPLDALALLRAAARGKETLCSAAAHVKRGTRSRGSHALPCERLLVNFIFIHLHLMLLLLIIELQ